jgi:N-acetylglucosamine-6-phosphate deacetylase
MIFRGGRIILHDAIHSDGAVRVTDGKIVEVARGALEPQPGEEIVELGGAFLAPGFIDLHIHGALRRDTMEATEDAFRTICRFHARGGTTALALTTLTAERDDILAVLTAVEKFRREPPDGAAVLGVHSEGPYFSREKPGAHRPHLIRNPEPSEYETFLAHREIITQMTIAPELPGALELIGRLSESGIRASGGHSDAWDEDAAAAFAHGMRQVTHTFNCMSSARRRGPFRVAGLLEFAMGEPEILCELIADGRHVFPTLLRMLYQAKGREGIALITDAAPGAGLPEGTRFGLGEIECVVRDEVGMTADGRALAGSTATMIRCVRNMVALANVPLVEAVQMATWNPARALGLETRKGTIAAGADADLVILDDALEVRRTFVAGRPVAY